MAKSLGNGGRGHFIEYNNIKNIITSKFNLKLCCNKELNHKRKWGYYKEVIKHNLKYQKYLVVLIT